MCVVGIMDPWEKTIGEAGRGVGVGFASLWEEVPIDEGSDNTGRQRRGRLCRAAIFLMDVTLQNPTDIDALGLSEFVDLCYCYGYWMGMWLYAGFK